MSKVEEWEQLEEALRTLYAKCRRSGHVHEDLAPMIRREVEATLAKIGQEEYDAACGGLHQPEGADRC